MIWMHKKALDRPAVHIYTYNLRIGQTTACAQQVQALTPVVTVSDKNKLNRNLSFCCYKQGSKDVFRIFILHEILKLVKCKTSHYKYIFASTVLKFLSSRRKLIAGIFNLSVWVYHKINTFLLMEMVVDLIIPKIWCYIYMKVLICLNNQASVVSILLRKLSQVIKQHMVCQKKKFRYNKLEEENL